MGIQFGTEGWRAIIGEEFTGANVQIVAQAIADHLTPGRRAVRVVVGYDTRLLSERFAALVARVLAGNGIETVLSDRTVPTCAVSRYVVAHRLTAGVMVTASHNPAAYNGIKVKEAFGGSATAGTVASIERRLGRSTLRSLPLRDAARRGLVHRANLLPDYLRGIRAAVDLARIRSLPLRVLVDPMHGAGNGLVARLLAGGRCHVRMLRADPDVRFGGEAPEPIPSHLMELARTLRNGRWTVGMATDGDADRLGIIAPNGSFLNPGQVLCVLLDHLLASRGWHGTVVKTVSNTSMINRLAERRGLPLLEVPVGFKHIAALMQRDQVLIGGEESGGIGVRGYLPERDGILAGLLLLEAIATRRQGILEILRALEQECGRWAYARRDLRVPTPQLSRFFGRLTDRPPRAMAGLPIGSVNRLDGVKLIGQEGSWLLFRRSGTEPLVRVYAESHSTGAVRRLLDFGVRLIGAA